MINTYVWISGFIVMVWFAIRWAFIVADKLPIWLNEDWRNQAEEFLEVPSISPPPNYRWWTPIFLMESRHHTFHWIPIVGPWLDNKKKQAVFECMSVPFSLLLLDAPALHSVLGIAFLGICLCLSLIDQKTMLLPDVLVYPLLWLGLLKAAVEDNHAVVYLMGAILGFFLLFVLQQGFKLLRGKDGMGGGDVKLLAAVGAWVGSLYIIPDVLFACVLSIVIYACTAIFGKAENKFPFGPSIAIAGFLFYVSLPYLNV